MKRKILFFFLALNLLITQSLSHSLSAFAQTAPIPTIIPGTWFNPTIDQFAQKINGAPEAEMFGERYTFAQVNWIISSLYMVLCPKCGMDMNQFKQFVVDFLGPPPAAALPSLDKYAQFGLPGLAVAGIETVLTHPPASGTREIGQTLAKFNLASPVFAQGGGYGYEAMSPLRLIWSASRNMAYFLMVILLVAAGFMIMFRVKINPQTAVTLQMMIPKIIISLVLVTFSYAIAGLVFDLVYLVITLVIALFGTASAGNPAIFSSLPDAIQFFTNSEYRYVVLFFITPWLNLFALGGLGLLTAIPFISQLGALTAIIGIIAIIFLLWTLLKIWWMLVKTYLMLMILIIIGPWQIVTGLLPNQKGFGAWFRNILAHASVFVVVPLMVFFIAVFWNPSTLSFLSSGAAILEEAFTGRGWIYKPVGNVDNSVGFQGNLPKLPFMNTSGFILQFFLGYAMLALIPKAADMVKESLKVPAFKYGTAFGEAISPISVPVGGAIASRGKSISERPGANMLDRLYGGVQQAVGQAIQKPS